jgi:hypothetical protein
VDPKIASHPLPARRIKPFPVPPQRLAIFGDLRFQNSVAQFDLPLHNFFVEIVPRPLLYPIAACASSASAQRRVKPRRHKGTKKNAELLWKQLIANKPGSPQLGNARKADNSQASAVRILDFLPCLVLFVPLWFMNIAL